jgi:hypothetical protein
LPDGRRRRSRQAHVHAGARGGRGPW